MERDPSAFVGRLHAALEGYDEAGAEHVVDEVLERFALEDAIVLVFMPFLVEVGDRWESGELSVTQEHFASHIVRSRLSAIGAGMTAEPDRPTVVVACPPGERHDIALLAFSLLLRREGWRVRFLGADTPTTDLAFACRRIKPDLVVVATSRSTALLGAAPELRKVAARHPVAIAGGGASRELAKELGVVWLEGDVTEGARQAVRVLRHEPAG
ncbi:MAG TPA: B12-binding domain-containing protein [Lapillicoccus sp.]|nr:B12-binding domain-containing protein [Lapillicoccus sp.]